MKQFSVSATITLALLKKVNAESKQEAWEIVAKALDGECPVVLAEDQPFEVTSESWWVYPPTEEKPQ